MSEKNTIYLRAFQENDYKTINKWRNDRILQSLVSTSFKYVSEELEKEWVKSKMVENQKEIYLAICLTDSDQMVGYLSLNNINHINRSASIGGIVIDKEYQDGFIQFQAFKMILEHAYEDLNLHRVEAKCLESHKVSKIIIQALGFSIEGLLREAVFSNGKYHNQLILSLLKTEFKSALKLQLSSYINFAKKIKEITKTYK